MSPRPFQIQQRHHHTSNNISDQFQHYSCSPQFVTSYVSVPQNQSHPYYHNSVSPCNVATQYTHYNMLTDEQDVAQAARPKKKQKTGGAKKTTKPTAPGKGLRHFSMKICEKVKQKGTSSYNEVADELIAELRKDEVKMNQHSTEQSGKSTSKKKRTKSLQSQYDEKNIRRRVYDALNVLMAMDIIVKDKKMIVWNGLPCERSFNSTNYSTTTFTELPQKGDEVNRFSMQQIKLTEERARRQAEVKRKREILQELITQNICFNNLYQRNHAREVTEMISPRQDDQESEKISLPFIVVNTNHNAVVQCKACPRKTSVTFNFTTPFEINDDNEILKKIGMNRITDEELQRMLPPELYRYSSSRGLVKCGYTNA